jgi:hypothetical protein
MMIIISEALVNCNTRAASVSRGRIRSAVKFMSLAHLTTTIRGTLEEMIIQHQGLCDE